MVHTPSFSSPDSYYIPELGQVMVEQEGAFQGTSSRIEIPYNYGQSSFSKAMFPEPLRHQFQWSDDEEEASGYASSATISSVQARFVSANMADNNNDDDFCHRMEAQEQTSKTQQEALDNIQQILAQLLTNRNNDNTNGSNHENEEKNTMNLPRPII